MSLQEDAPDLENEMPDANIRALAVVIGEAALGREISGEELTKDERKVLENVSLGVPAKEIAHSIVHSSSVFNLRRTHYKSIRKKLGARNMSHAVRLAIEGKDIEIFALDHIESPLLTGREFDVLKLLSYGAKKKEIAEVLGISPITVATYLGRALPKLGAASEEHAVRITFETGIFKMPEDRA